VQPSAPRLQSPLLAPSRDLMVLLTTALMIYADFAIPLGSTT
jgi:hypothetical protein